MLIKQLLLLMSLTMSGFALANGPDNSAPLAVKHPEKPPVTVILCADLPRHSNILEKIPGDHLFVVSNLGNQLATSLGSVDYGINTLAASTLLIIGHNDCQAIHFASNRDHSILEPAIARDFATLRVVQGGATSDNIKMNIHSQVALALQRYATRVKNGELLVIGAIYEKLGETPQAEGRLNIININGETNIDKLNNITTTATQVSD